MVVPGCYIGYQWAKNIKWSTVTNLLLDFHIVLYLVKRHVAGTFDHNLAALFLGPGGKLAEGP